MIKHLSRKWKTTLFKWQAITDIDMLLIHSFLVNLLLFKVKVPLSSSIIQKAININPYFLTCSFQTTDSTKPVTHFSVKLDLIENKKFPLDCLLFIVGLDNIVRWLTLYRGPRCKRREERRLVGGNTVITTHRTCWSNTSKNTFKSH